MSPIAAKEREYSETVWKRLERSVARLTHEDHAVAAETEAASFPSFTRRLEIKGFKRCVQVNETQDMSA